MGLERYFRWAELPARTDIDVWEGSTRWGNHDLYPIPRKERTYGTPAFFAYYGASAISVFGFTAASAYVASGLSVWETVGAIIIGGTIAAVSTFFGARPGIDLNLGYTMMTRVTFGLWGSTLPLFIVLLANIAIGGMTAYYGGQSVAIILAAVIPQFHELPNTLPASAAITTQNLIGFILYFVIFIPIIYFVPVFKLRKFLYPAVIVTAATLLGMLGWVIHQNGGTGPLVASTVQVSGVDKSFLFIQCVSSTAASWGATGDRFSDWTRFSKRKHASTPAIMTGAPVLLTLTAIVGALTTSAFFSLYKQVIWTPLGMLSYVQQVSYTPVCRAGTFFAGVGLLTSLIYVNICQSTVAFGMDFAGIFPKYISMRRGAIVMAVLCIAINPWRFLSQASIFITVISTFSIFSSATSPLLSADYWLVRKRKWKVPDLYHENGIYWYNYGCNWRAFVAWIVAILPSFPGAIHSIMGVKYEGGVDYKMYQMTYFIGMPLSIALYWVICWAFPPPGLGISVPLPQTVRESAEGSAEDMSPDGEFKEIDPELATTVVERKSRSES